MPRDHTVQIAKQMTALVWQMTVNLWMRVAHSSWQIIHQKWKIALRSPCDNRRHFRTRWPIDVCNSTIVHRNDWEMVCWSDFFIRSDYLIGKLLRNWVMEIWFIGRCDNIITCFISMRMQLQQKKFLSQAKPKISVHNFFLHFWESIYFSITTKLHVNLCSSH